MSMDMMYDVRCQSDSMRVTRNSKVCCITCCPVSEKTITLSVTDGRMIFWEILLAQVKKILKTFLRNHLPCVGLTVGWIEE